jgi:hypothetical protein
MTSFVPPADVRDNGSLIPHQLFREAANRGFLFNAPNGTAVTITPFTAKCAGLYGVVMTTGSNVSFGLFRLDDGGTVTIIQDASALLTNSATPSKVGIFVQSGTALRLHNQLAASADCDLNIFRIATA